MLEIGYCIDCNELNYAMTNGNGSFERANMSNNHEGHRQYIFGKPESYSPPIRNVLAKLHMPVKIPDNEIILFKMALEMEKPWERRM